MFARLTRLCMNARSLKFNSDVRINIPLYYGPARGCSESSLGRIQTRMGIVYSCKVCGTRSSKTFAKKSYQEGIVIVRCPGCENLHLIADNLGWFKDADQARNVEQLLAEKGETVRRVTHSDGTVELEDTLLVNNDHKNKDAITPNTGEDPENSQKS